MKLNQQQLEDVICYHKFLYYEKAVDTMISDFEYDQLERELKDRFPDSVVLTYTECPRELWPKYLDRYERAKERIGA